MPYWADPYTMQLASTALIAAMFALSLQILTGAAGLVSLAHAGFFGVGAYSVWLLGEGSILVSLPLATLSAAIAAAVIGPIALRTRGGPLSRRKRCGGVPTIVAAPARATDRIALLPPTPRAMMA